MIISNLEKVSFVLAKKLALFESSFVYPLGKNDTFTISHAPDYCGFYSSMGDGIVLIAESEEGEVLGSFCSAIRRVKKPLQNYAHEASIAYLGDLKIIKSKQKTRLFFHLASAMKRKILEKTNISIGVVMDGTDTSHLQPMERLGFPPIYPIDKRVVLCIQTTNQILDSTFQINLLNNEKGFSIFEEMAMQDYFLQSDSALRSQFTPVWLVSANHIACGKLEDTLLAKRLFNSHGELIKAAHLSYFTSMKPEDGYRLLLKALQMSYENGFSSLFVAMTEQEYELLKQYLTGLSYVYAPATIFGNENAKKLNLQINTAEI